MSSEAVVVVAQPGLDAKREDAKALLGTNWVGHPLYRFNPRHSTNPDLYAHARQPYLLKVSEAAAKDRAKNIAFARAEAVRIALS